jgi:hypothetical protein
LGEKKKIAHRNTLGRATWRIEDYRYSTSPALSGFSLINLKQPVE